MSLRNSQPTPFSPSGVTDAVDGTNAPAGSMAALVNLIPDPSTSNVFTCRPAAELLLGFGAFSSGFIPVFHISGMYIFGMIASTLVPGYDQPFCYNAQTDAFVPVTGLQDATTLPLSQSTSGEWTPPTMELVGALLIVTHPGFPGGVGAYFGWFDLTIIAAPVWNAGNTTINPLPAVPVAVAQFSGRAYFAVDNAAWFTDSLAPTVITNANQVLICGDNEPVTALAGLPLATFVSGGVVQCLIAFKGATIMYQITGDATSGDLALNANTVHTGTLGPNTIVPTPKGLAFVSPDGLRIMDFQLAISDPIGNAGTGVTLPFLYAIEPSRMCAAYNNTVIRISVQNGKAPGTPFQEWWFHTARACWTGPHTFPASFIHSFTHPAGGEHPSFVMAPQGVTGQLYDSHSFPSLTPTYVENGVQMAFEFTTSILPDTFQMSETSIVEQTINMALPAGSSVTAASQDQDGTVIDTVPILGGTPTVWGAFTWGAGIWRGAASNYRPRQIQWSEGITWRMLSIKVTGDSIADFQVGTLYSRLNTLGYLQQEAP